MEDDRRIPHGSDNGARILTLEDGGLTLYTMDTRRLEDSAYFRERYNQLSAARRAKIDWYRLPRDKRLSLGAGILLDRGLRAYGLKEVNARFAQKKNGKPYLPEAPGIHFSLSHSRERVLAVFADAEVGCDIEYTGDADLEVAKRCFRPEEYAYLASLEGKQQNSAFFQLWTLKESFLKATGVGMELPLDAFGFRVSGGVIHLRQTYDPYDYVIRQYRFGPYWAAVCTRL